MAKGRVRIVAAGCGGVLVGAAAFLLLVPFDSPELGRAILERASAATGSQITAKGFRLRLLSGLELDGVEASSSFTGGSYSLSLDRLIFEHRLLPLLIGRVSVSRIVLRRPRIEMVETGTAGRPSAARGATAPALPGGLSLRVSQIAIEDGSLRLRARTGQATATVTGLDLRMHDLAVDPAVGSAMKGLSAEGELKIEEIALAPTRVRGAQGRFRLALGRLKTDALRFQTDQGSFDGEFGASLDRLPFTYTLSLKGDPLDVNALAGSGEGRGFGPGSLVLTGAGRGAEPSGLSGKGVLKIGAGSLPSTPLLAALERSLGRTRLVGAPYKATEAPFRIDRGRVLVEGFRLETGQVGIEAGGSVSPEGPLDLSVSVRTPREGLAVQEISADVLDTLTDDQGWVRIPFKITGTQQAPRVLPDAGALASQAGRGGVKVLARKAASGIGGLFHKDKKKPR